MARLVARARTSSAIRCGWLCSSGGSGCTTTGHSGRATSSAAGCASAPQAISAICLSATERELLDESVVEVGAITELDILHLLEQRVGAGSLAHRQQGHLGAFARYVASGDYAEHGQLGNQPDPDSRGGGEVGAERAGQQHLLYVVMLEAQLLEQQGPAGGDGGLRELQLADVALREVDGLGRVGVRERGV